MATLVAVALAVVAVGTALGLLRRSRCRIRDLEVELGQVYEAQHIVDQARARKNRSHLHLLATLPLAWVAGRLQSPTARLAAATAASTMVAGASFVATDSHPPKQLTPPAAADTTHPAPMVPDDDYPLSELVPPTTSPSSAAVAPPAASAVAPGSTPPVAPGAASTPEPTTTTSSTSTTTTVLELVVPEACVNPHGILLPEQVCLSG